MGRILSLSVLAVLACLATALGGCGSAIPPPTVESAGIETPVVEPSSSPPTLIDTPAPAVSPTTAPSPTVTPPVALTPTVAPSEIDNELDITSYHARSEVFWQGTLTNGQEVSGSIIIVAETAGQPPVDHLVMSGDYSLMQLMYGAQGVEGNTIELYDLGDTEYMGLAGGWMQQSRPSRHQEGLNGLALAATSDILGGLTGLSLLGMETIEGIATQHYRFDQQTTDASQLTVSGEIEEAQGDLYMAAAAAYPVRLVAAVTGSQLKVPGHMDHLILGHGTYRLSFELTDVNRPILVAPPREAIANSGVPDDIPIPGGVRNLRPMINLINYYSDQAIGELVDFYKSEMPAHGWKLASATEVPDDVQLEFSKEGRKASVHIQESPTSSGLSRRQVDIKLAKES